MEIGTELLTYFHKAFSGYTAFYGWGVQAGISEYCGLSNSKISGIMQLKRRPTLEAMDAIAGYFGWDIIEFLEIGRFFHQTGVFTPCPPRLKQRDGKCMRILCEESRKVLFPGSNVRLQPDERMLELFYDQNRDIDRWFSECMDLFRRGVLLAR